MNLEEIVESNFLTKILDIEKLFNLYKRFNLSIIGKVTVIKTLALPKLEYLLTVLPNPEQKINNRIGQMFPNFLWEDTVRIARSFLDQTLLFQIKNHVLNWTLSLCKIYKEIFRTIFGKMLLVLG